MAKQEHGPACNTARFIPGRRPRMVNEKLDDRIFFPSLRYSSTAAKTDKEVVAGIGFGPGQHMPKEDPGPGFKMSPGGLVIPTQPSDDYKTIPVRDFSFVDETSGKRYTRQYVDLTTFKQIAPGIIRAMPHYKEDEVYYEIWSGHPEGATEETKQLIQANMFISGAVAYSGATTLLDTASTQDLTEEDKLPIGIEGRTLSQKRMATLLKERLGDIFCGVFLWTSRLYRVRFSRKESEAVLVRHLGKAWMLTGHPDRGHVIDELPPNALPTVFKRFERLSLEQPLKLPEEMLAA